MKISLWEIFRGPGYIFTYFRPQGRKFLKIYEIVCANFKYFHKFELKIQISENRPRGDYTARTKRLHCSISVKRSSKYLTHLPYGFHRSSSRGFYHDFAYAHLAHLASRESFIALYPRAQHALLPPRTPLRLMAETTIAGIQPALPYYALTPHTRKSN
jgi:hypothetical protein